MEDKPTRYGCTTIEHLQILHGRPVDDVAKSYISALRPSKIRYCKRGCTMDCCPWRVTVWLNEDDTIKRISQEVEFEIYGDIRNGYDLRLRLEGKEYPWKDGEMISVCNAEAIKNVKFV